MRPRYSGIIAILMLAAVALASAQSSSTKTFAPPRTPWGDPDLQGVWPGTEMVGVPLQRPQQFGSRNVLTEDEFQARVKQAQQTDEDALADFDVTKADTRNAGAVGSATSPPPHWLERGKPSRQASLIVDPPDGRQPAQVPEAQKRKRSAHGTARASSSASSSEASVTYAKFEPSAARRRTASTIAG